MGWATGPAGPASPRIHINSGCAMHLFDGSSSIPLTAASVFVQCCEAAFPANNLSALPGAGPIVAVLLEPGGTPCSQN